MLNNPTRDKEVVKKEYQKILAKFKQMFPDIQIKQWWRMSHGRIKVRGKTDNSDYFDVKFRYYEFTSYRGKDEELVDLPVVRVVAEASFDYYI